MTSCFSLSPKVPVFISTKTYYPDTDGNSGAITGREKGASNTKVATVSSKLGFFRSALKTTPILNIDWMAELLLLLPSLLPKVLAYRARTVHKGPHSCENFETDVCV